MTTDYTDSMDLSRLSREQRSIVHLGEALAAVERDNRAAMLRSMLFANHAVTLDVSDVLIAYGGWLLRCHAGAARTPAEPPRGAQPMPAAVAAVLSGPWRVLALMKGRQA